MKAGLDRLNPNDPRFSFSHKNWVNPQEMSVLLPFFTINPKDLNPKKKVDLAGLGLFLYPKLINILIELPPSSETPKGKALFLILSPLL